MERALLVTVDLKNRKNSWEPSDKARELKELAISSGAEVLVEMTVRRNKPSPAYYIGKGKACEIAEICQEKNIECVIFNNDLTGSQQKNLEDIINIKTIDRTQLILDIFARRAKSNEGKIQVELAQLLYLLPRLTGRGILLSRLGGGIGTRGPGEKKLEIDRRRIHDRIVKLKRDLTRLTLQRQTRKKHRARFSVLKIAIIGYTNSGKSTLLNALTDSNVITQDRLFSTLDPTIRSYTLPNNQKVFFVDTVGFLNELPYHLIESFKATLEEVVTADILLHLIDASHPRAKDMENAVYGVLKELGVENKEVITCLNKIDRLSEYALMHIQRQFKDAIPISARYKKNLEMLIDRIVLYIGVAVRRYKLFIPQSRLNIVNLVYEKGNVIRKKYTTGGIVLEAELKEDVFHMIKKRLNLSSG